MLDVHIIVTEVHWAPCELLSVESYIDGVLEDLGVEVVQVGDLGDDLTVLEVAFSRHPNVLVIHRVTATDLRSTALGSLADLFATLDTGMIHTHLIGVSSGAIDMPITIGSSAHS